MPDGDYDVTAALRRLASDGIEQLRQIREERDRLYRSLSELVNSPNAKSNAMWDRARAAIDFAFVGHGEPLQAQVTTEPLESLTALRQCLHDNWSEMTRKARLAFSPLLTLADAAITKARGVRS